MKPFSVRHLRTCQTFFEFKTCLFRTASIFGMLLALYVVPVFAFAQNNAFSFGVINPSVLPLDDDAQLRQILTVSDTDNLAFIVSNGIKSLQEPCTDQFLLRRKSLFDSAKNGLILSLSAGDWNTCVRENGDSIAVDRLNRVRDLFFDGDFSFGESKIPLTRQARIRQFRTYVENAHWNIGDLLFATINLPANNNNFLLAAGRNNEFDDRQIANRDWVRRLFSIARQRNAAAIVLFCDGDPMSEPGSISRAGPGPRRDGFIEIRKQIAALSGKFPGKVMLVHRLKSFTRVTELNTEAAAKSTIVWRGNVGNLTLNTAWMKINVDPTEPMIFTIENGETAQKILSHP